MLKTSFKLPLTILFSVLLSFMMFSSVNHQTVKADIFGFKSAPAVNPKPSENFYVNDYAKIGNPAFTELFTKFNERFKNTKQHPTIILLTVHDTSGMKPLDYIKELQKNKRWNRYDRDGNNNTVVILYSMNLDKDSIPTISIVAGKALENALTSVAINNILNKNYQLLKATTDYEGKTIPDVPNNLLGLMNVGYQVMLALNANYATKSYSQVKISSSKNLDTTVIFFCSVFVIGIIFAGYVYIREKQKQAQRDLNPADRWTNNNNNNMY